MRISDWSSDVCASDLILEGEGRERLGTVLGDQHLLLQLHALAAILLADVALDADRHAGLEDAVVAGGVEVLQVDHRRILVAEPDAVHHHRIAVGPAACRQSPGAIGQLSKAEAGPQELQIEGDLLPREAIEPAMSIDRPAVAAKIGSAHCLTT